MKKTSTLVARPWPRGFSRMRTPLISLSPHGSSAWVAGTAVRPEDLGKVGAVWVGTEARNQKD